MRIAGIKGLNVLVGAIWMRASAIDFVHMFESQAIL